MASWPEADQAPRGERGKLARGSSEGASSAPTCSAHHHGQLRPSLQHRQAFWVNLQAIAERSLGMKQILPVITVAVAFFASPALACDMHQDHTALKTVAATPAPPPPPAPQ